MEVKVLDGIGRKGRDRLSRDHTQYIRRTTQPSVRNWTSAFGVYNQLMEEYTPIDVIRVMSLKRRFTRINLDQFQGKQTHQQNFKHCIPAWRAGHKVAEAEIAWAMLSSLLKDTAWNSLAASLYSTNANIFTSQKVLKKLSQNIKDTRFQDVQDQKEQPYPQNRVYTLSDVSGAMEKDI